MKDNPQKIYLKNFKGNNIYIKLNSTFQKSLFSEFSFKELDLSPSAFSHCKLNNVAFPLDIFLKMIKHLNLGEDFLYNKISEIKYGQCSKPLLNPKFPITKDPYYWNILFSLFCDGSSDQWSSQRNRRIISPSYSSYSSEIMNSFIKIVKFKFGEFRSKPSWGNFRLPPILDVIFKSQHDINSFNTKSNKIPKFVLTNNFKKEIKNLSNLNKISILIRYFIDEGDKSEISLNPRSINLTIASASKSLVDILEIILTSLKIDYHIIYRKTNNLKWSDSYLVQIKKGNSRENLKRFYKMVLKLNKKYGMLALTSIQMSSIKRAIKYKYKKPIPQFSHSKTIHFLIYKFLLRKSHTNFNDVNKMLISGGFNLGMSSILHILSGMPIIRKQGKIFVDNKKIRYYFPYSKKDIIAFKKYHKAIKLYSSGKKISHISRELDSDWSTVRNWVYRRSKPRISHSMFRKLI